MGMLARAYASLSTEALAATIDLHLLHSRQAETRSERLWHLIAHAMPDQRRDDGALLQSVGQAGDPGVSAW